MQKFKCNSCDNVFFQEPADVMTCPACGSNSLKQLSENPTGPFWKSRTLIVTFASMFIMILILVFLPGRPKDKTKNIIYVDYKPETCRITITIRHGDSTVNASGYKYSVDNGYNWGDHNVYYSQIKRGMNILVRSKNPDDESVIEYEKNPLAYNPVSQPIAPDPCNCRKLQVYSIVPDPLTKKSITIQASLPDCQKEYSISGASGPFQKENVFQVTPGKKYMIFIRSGKCPSVAYFKNPYTAENIRQSTPPPTPPTPVTHSEKTIQEGSTNGGQVYDEEETDKDQYSLKPSCCDTKTEFQERVRKCVVDPGFKGTIELTVIAETDGNLDHYSFPSQVSSDLSTKIKSCIEGYGIWLCGHKSGNPVRTRLKLSFQF